MNIENINLTEELILKASACKTSEELLTLALENGVTITMEQLPELMAEVAKKCSGELSDDALEVASAVGGKANYTDSMGRHYKVVTVGYHCNRCICEECHGFGYEYNTTFHDKSCSHAGMISTCRICIHMTRKDGLWLCLYGC